jgi:hypothetical protein
MHSIVKKQFVQLDGTLSSATPQAGPTPASALPRPAAGAAVGRRCEKSARPITIDGAIRANEVTCSCGETTTIELEYPHA